MNKVKVFILAFLFCNFAYAGGEMKKVCIDDAKTKKQICKTVIYSGSGPAAVPPAAVNNYWEFFISATPTSGYPAAEYLS